MLHGINLLNHAIFRQIFVHTLRNKLGIGVIDLGLQRGGGGEWDGLGTWG